MRVCEREILPEANRVKEEGKQLLGHTHNKLPDGEMRSLRFDPKE